MDAAAGGPPGRAGGRDDLEALTGDAERRTERVIALVRIVVGLVLGLSLSAVLGERPRDDLLLARQAVIAYGTICGYAAVGAAALVLSAPRFWRRWYSYLFVTADAVFLHAGALLAMHNIGVATNYAVALPTLWIIPILVAIGAMRYSPLLQGYAMALLVGGFAYLLLPGVSWPDAVGITPPAEINPMFARQPNAVRLAMMAAAATVLVIAVYRTRQLLRTALEEGMRRRSLTRFLPPEVARLIEARPAGDLRAGRHQEAAVLFVDIRDFTRRTETMPPEEVGTLLSAFRAELRAAAQAEGGVIDKFIGDGAMIVWGVPEPRPDDPARAVRCGRDILARVARLPGRLAVGIGVHCGPAFVGAVGDEARLEFTVLGDTVNVAARVEEATRRIGAALLVTGTVAERAGLDGPDWRSCGTTEVRGRVGAVELFALE